MKRSLIICVIGISMFNTRLFAQSDGEKKEIIRTDANIKSGNYRDVLTNFFQLAFNDLTGKDKRLRFSSNLFAIRLKTNPDLDIDYNFVKNTFWRNSNVDLDIKLDSNFNFNGASFGYKYALINRRDYALSKNFQNIYRKTLEQYNIAFDIIIENLNEKYGQDEEMLTLYNSEIYSFIKEKKGKLRDLSDEAQELIRYAVPSMKPDDNFGKLAQEEYKDLVKKYKNKLLWTMAANFSTYSDGFLFSNIDVISQATANMISLGNYSNIEFDVKASYAFLEDTAKTGKNIDRNTFALEGGFNLVFTNRTTLKPLIEFKATTSYNSVIRGLYLNETKNKFMLNGTLRFRITDDIWIPVSIKYDPDEANVFGFLSIKSNFDWFKGK